jgi:molecular chaperone Hsp33
MTPVPALSDQVLPFRIERSGVRGRLVRLESALNEILAPHDYPPSVAGLLAETVALAAVLASALKYDGIFTLQIQGDGPVKLLLADVTSTGDLRGYAQFSPERVAEAEKGTGAPVPRFLGNGNLAFTVDQGPDTERYQGITDLAGATINDCAHNYFRQSEQLDSAIVIATSRGEDGMTPRAAALTIQRLPLAQGADPDELSEEWRRTVILLSSITGSELLDPTIPSRDILWRLFHEDGVRVYKSRPLRHACRCSRAKVERTLRSFPREEIEAMAEDKVVTVTCEFCKSNYIFDDDALDALYPTAALK